MGEFPDFVPVIAEARHLGVAPWDLIGVPESAGMECWLLWSQWSRELGNHAARVARLKAERKR